MPSELWRRCRLLIAIDRALVTSVAVRAESMDQPTTLRE
jgi:hypothetical protein